MKKVLFWLAAVISTVFADWRHQSCSNWPRGRSGATLSAINGTTWLVFGGSLGTCPTSPTVNELWVLQSSAESCTWTQLIQTGASKPPARTYHAAAVVGSDGLIMYGGSGVSGILGDLWYLETYHHQWIPLLGSAGGLAGHTMVTVPCAWGGNTGCKRQLRQALLFAGANETGVNNAVWSVRPDSESALTPSVPSYSFHRLATQGEAPAPRAHHGATTIQPHAAGSDCMVVFGGIAAAGNVLADVWFLCGGSVRGIARWAPGRLQAGEARPAARQGAVFEAYNTSSWLVFGGATAEGMVFGDTWLGQVTSYDVVSDTDGSVAADTAAGRQRASVTAFTIAWQCVSTDSSLCNAATPGGAGFPAARAFAASATGQGATGALVFGGVQLLADDQQHDVWQY